MKLRNFLYLNTKVIEDYIAAIDGYTYDEESQAIATSSENALTGKSALGIASGSGSHTGKQSEEIKRSVHISDAATIVAYIGMIFWKSWLLLAFLR